MNRPAGSSHYHKPRGSFVINAIYAKDPGSNVHREVLTSDNDVYVEFSVVEPLLLSPFVFGAPDNKQGFYGISNMQFQFNMAATASRAWRAVRWNFATNAPTLSKTAVIDKFENSQLTFSFLTAHPTLRLPSRNIVPFYELPV